MKISRARRVFKLYDQLPKSEKALKQHVVSLGGMTGGREHQELFDHLYGCLSILDSKSSSLLSFNSIIIAVFAIFMTGELRGVERITITIGMASVMVSCLLLLSVVWVHWSTTENLSDLESHALVLLRVRRSRTIKYRLAWYFAVGSLGALSAFLIMRGVLSTLGLV
jgi:hypothetical protein